MDTHQWRQAPYQPQPCPVCFSPHYPYCPPPPSYGGAHLQQPHPYPAAHPPPKRMRVEDPYPPDIPPKEDRILNLIRDHGRQGESQDPGFGSYQNFHVQPSGYNNDPYNNPYPASQNFTQSYRPAPGYYGYNRVENGYGYRPDPSQLYNWAQSAPPPPPPPPQAQPPPPPPPQAPPPPLDFVPQKNPSLFPIVSSGPARTAPVPSSVYNFAQTNTSLPLGQDGTTVCLPSVSEPITKASLNLTAKPISAQPTVINACDLFKHPQRASRPDHFVVILRGLPGSGKSYLAKALRDVEVENGGSAPRIHSIDDYFMIEVEKDANDGDSSKSRSKKLTKKVIEYCYEAEMEETYRSSMLKAFRKTLDEGNFTFVIVDDRNLRVADFSQFWAVAKRSAYEVYLLEAPYKDPTGCAARNLHGFTLDDVKKMADQWEEAPPVYLQLDVRPLLSGDYLKEETIKEVEMDMEDDMVPPTENVPENCNSTDVYNVVSYNNDNVFDEKAESIGDEAHAGVLKGGESWDSEEEEAVGVKDIRQSKWSKNIEEETEKPESSKGNEGVLSGLMQAYGKRKSRKSIHWGDWAEIGGFSIGSAAQKRAYLSLVIGPGSGYNLKSNPLIDEEKESLNSRGKINPETKKLLSEQLRAERESFKAIFDRRRLRIEDE
ncbi:P-loop containing nucleoside triphosphate hydrolases superfamily protein [Rhynchospora pubera]|uniref:P-loop containing nucleoside triphosphate hydrolases superfamily protein n=1 Tax=Rhynchospora pubera TaxID=906938 RepID=A0AAV8FEM6_9POAL|nr:P-loop containing nucleoside triphosphate hydrolases superfamily protein [Rhynchospora pubera]